MKSTAAKKKFVFSAFATLVLCLAVSGPGYSAENWQTYENGRFGYSVEYPDIFSQSRESDNGDGTAFESEDGEYTLAVWGGHNIFEEDGAALLRGCYDRVAHIVPGSEKSGEGFYSIEYSDEGGRDGTEHIYHEYGVVNPNTKAGYILSYPKDEEKRFAEIKSKMDASLKLPSGKAGQEAADEGGFANYSLKDGKVYNGKTELDREVHEIPPGLDLPIAYWAAGDGAVLFFTRDGQIIADISGDDLGLNGYVDLAWSTDGSRLALVDASGVRNFYVDAYVYGEGLERQAAISTLREDGFLWIDNARLVFTQIGDAREGGAFPMNDVKLSVALYDAATGETAILKEAGDKQNFVFTGLSDDGREIVITEFAVKSPADWADEEKTTTREIRVGIPAAG